jgi:hypothetical protein
VAIGTPTSLGVAEVSNGSANQTIGGITAAVGDLLILVAGNDGGGAPTGVTDPGGNTWTRDEFNHVADSHSESVFSCVVTTALSSATLTVAHGTSGTWDRFIAVTKVTGSWDSTRKDKTAKATGATGATWDSGVTATTAAANELVFGLGVMGYGGTSASVTSTPGTGLTELHDVDTGSWVGYTTVYRLVSSTGTYKANGTWTGLTSKPWGAIVVTYKEAAGGGGTPQTLAATMASSGGLTASLKVEKKLAAALESTSTLAAALRDEKPIAASLDSTSGLAADLQVSGSKLLAASLDSTSGLTAALAVPKRIAATIASTSSLTAALGVTRSLAATFASTATLAASMRVAKPLAATMASAGQMFARLTVGTELPARVYQSLQMIRTRIGW